MKTRKIKSIALISLVKNLNVDKDETERSSERSELDISSRSLSVASIMSERTSRYLEHFLNGDGNSLYKEVSKMVDSITEGHINSPLGNEQLSPHFYHEDITYNRNVYHQQNQQIVEDFFMSTNDINELQILTTKVMRPIKYLDQIEAECTVRYSWKTDKMVSDYVCDLTNNFDEAIVGELGKMSLDGSLQNQELFMPESPGASTSETMSSEYRLKPNDDEMANKNMQLCREKNFEFSGYVMEKLKIFSSHARKENVIEESFNQYERLIINRLSGDTLETFMRANPIDLNLVTLSKSFLGKSKFIKFIIGNLKLSISRKDLDHLLRQFSLQPSLPSILYRKLAQVACRFFSNSTSAIQFPPEILSMSKSDKNCIETDERSIFSMFEENFNNLKISKSITLLQNLVIKSSVCFESLDPSNSRSLSTDRNREIMVRSENYPNFPISSVENLNVVDLPEINQARGVLVQLAFSNYVEIFSHNLQLEDSTNSWKEFPEASLGIQRPLGNSSKDRCPILSTNYYSILSPDPSAAKNTRISVSEEFAKCTAEDFLVASDSGQHIDSFQELKTGELNRPSALYDFDTVPSSDCLQIDEARQRQNLTNSCSSDAHSRGMFDSSTDEINENLISDGHKTVGKSPTAEIDLKLLKSEMKEDLDSGMEFSENTTSISIPNGNMIDKENTSLGKDISADRVERLSQNEDCYSVSDTKNSISSKVSREHSQKDPTVKSNIADTEKSEIPRRTAPCDHHGKDTAWHDVLEQFSYPDSQDKMECINTHSNMDISMESFGAVNTFGDLMEISNNNELSLNVLAEVPQGKTDKIDQKEMLPDCSLPSLNTSTSNLLESLLTDISNFVPEDSSCKSGTAVADAAVDHLVCNEKIEENYASAMDCSKSHQDSDTRMDVSAFTSSEESNSLGLSLIQKELDGFSINSSTSLMSFENNFVQTNAPSGNTSNFVPPLNSTMISKPKSEYKSSDICRTYNNNSDEVTNSQGSIITSSDKLLSSDFNFEMLTPNDSKLPPETSDYPITTSTNNLTSSFSFSNPSTSSHRRSSPQNSANTSSIPSSYKDLLGSGHAVGSSAHTKIVSRDVTKRKTSRSVMKPPKRSTSDFIISDSSKTVIPAAASSKGKFDKGPTFDFNHFQLPGLCLDGLNNGDVSNSSTVVSSSKTDSGINNDKIEFNMSFEKDIQASSEKSSNEKSTIQPSSCLTDERQLLNSLDYKIDSKAVKKKSGSDKLETDSSNKNSSNTTENSVMNQNKNLLYSINYPSHMKDSGTSKKSILQNNIHGLVSKSNLEKLASTKPGHEAGMKPSATPTQSSTARDIKEQKFKLMSQHKTARPMNVISNPIRGVGAPPYPCYVLLPNGTTAVANLPIPNQAITVPTGYGILNSGNFISPVQLPYSSTPQNVYVQNPTQAIRPAKVPIYNNNNNGLRPNGQPTKSKKVVADERRRLGTESVKGGPQGTFLKRKKDDMETSSSGRRVTKAAKTSSVNVPQTALLASLASHRNTLTGGKMVYFYLVSFYLCYMALIFFFFLFVK